MTDRQSNVTAIVFSESFTYSLKQPLSFNFFALTFLLTFDDKFRYVFVLILDT